MNGVLKLEVIDLFVFLGFIDDLLWLGGKNTFVELLRQDLERGVPSEIVYRVVGGLDNVHPFADAKKALLHIYFWGENQRMCQGRCARFQPIWAHNFGNKVRWNTLKATITQRSVGSR